MLDLSPEKLMALLAVGLVVLGPHRLPAAARSLAQGLAKARRLAATLTDPLNESLAEPRQHLDRALADVRGVVYEPVAAFSANRTDAMADPPVVELPAFLPGENTSDVGHSFDPAEN